MVEWIIKPFKSLHIEELYEILKVRSEVFVVEQTCVFLDCDGKDKEAYHLFHMENGVVTAYVRILPKGLSYEEVSIGRVLVHPDYRGKGLARESMLSALDFIGKEWNEEVIRISAQEYLLKFYESIGFVAVSEVYLEDDIPHVEMVYKKKVSQVR